MQCKREIQTYRVLVSHDPDVRLRFLPDFFVYTLAYNIDLYLPVALQFLRFSASSWKNSISNAVVIFIG